MSKKKVNIHEQHLEQQSLIQVDYCYYYTFDPKDHCVKDVSPETERATSLQKLRLSLFPILYICY